MNPLPLIFGFLTRNMKWIVIGIAIYLIVTSTANYFNPEYCITDTESNQNSLEAYGFQVSNTNKDTNEICFRSNNQELVHELLLEINDDRLDREYELKKIQEENKQANIDRFFELEIFIPTLLLVFAIAYVWIEKNKKKH